MLKQRVITAIILLGLVGIDLFFLPLEAFVALISLVVLLAAWEWSDMAGLSTWQRPIFCVVVTTIAVAEFVYTGLGSSEVRTENLRQIFTLAVAWWAIALLLVQGYPGSAVFWRHPIMRAVMGVLVLCPAWLAFVYLCYLPQGSLWIVGLIGIVAAADIGAYFTGRRFGKRKLAVQVSPGKSWEGFWGGLVAVSVIAFLASSMMSQLSAAQLMVIAIVTALASVLGDLLESMVKRQRGIKDSGWMLPGHGGFMDRIDSLTAAAPVFALGLLAVLPTPLAVVVP
jgi:phosphatidate cytidylyltransferase